MQQRCLETQKNKLKFNFFKHLNVLWKNVSPLVSIVSMSFSQSSLKITYDSLSHISTGYTCKCQCKVCSVLLSGVKAMLS